MQSPASLLGFTDFKIAQMDEFLVFATCPQHAQMKCIYQKQQNYNFPNDFNLRENFDSISRM